MALTLAPNTTPIYPRTPIRWRVKLAMEVVPREVTTQTPILLGTAGSNGSIIHSVDVHHLGDNVATAIRLWTQQSDEDGYFLDNELSLTAISGSTNAAAIAPVLFTLPAILPSGNTGFHLTSGESLYCGLGTAIASGVIVIVRGGDY